MASKNHRPDSSLAPDDITVATGRLSVRDAEISSIA
jgi:hypothetical protein